LCATIIVMKLIGERRAVAAAVLALYGFFYLFLALAAMQPGWGPAYFSIAGIYGLGFFALVAGYFWARWYSLGVGISGLITGGFAIWQVGPEPIVLFIAGTHLLVTLALTGESMGEPFEGKQQWRTKLHMDSNAVTRLGNSVTRAAISLPYILLYALAPKPASMLSAQAACGFFSTTMLAATATALGLYGLIKMRTWGLLAIAGAALLMSVNALATHSASLTVMSTLAAGMLAWTLVPFAAPLVRRIKH
jgi:hypothetical protein